MRKIFWNVKFCREKYIQDIIVAHEPVAKDPINHHKSLISVGYKIANSQSLKYKRSMRSGSKVICHRKLQTYDEW